jgi:hypothetical protein
MICPQCSTQNDDDYVFCVNCGATIGDQYRTVKYQSGELQEPLPPTVYVKEAAYRPQPAPFVSEPTFERYATPAASYKVPLLVGLVVALAGIVGVAVFLIVQQWPAVVVDEKEVLPEYLGLFLKGQKGQQPVEIKRLEAANASEARNAMMADQQLLKVPSKPEFVLYADSGDIPLSGLKLVRLDSVTDDGRSKYADYQAAIIDDRPAMKRIMLPQSLASGRYAFVLYSGFFNEGTHRFWPFEVTAGDANGLKFEQEMSVAIKPPEMPNTPTFPEVEEPQTVIPAGATIAYCNATDVRMRGEPSTSSKILGKLTKGQKVYVLKYHEVAYLDGRGEVWARVQTEAGRQAWVFNSFLDHGQK